MQNQQRLHKDGKLPLDKLLACPENILKLDSKRVGKESAFQATEFIRKGKWGKLGADVKELSKGKLNEKEGELYFSILGKIQYIFPKPQAIAYAMIDWRTAYYKVYYPEAFYSVLLIYHATVYDLGLMTLDRDKSILFRLEKLLGSLDTLEASRKEFISISKVLLKLAKEDKKIRELTETIVSTGKSYYELFDLDEDCLSEQIKSSVESVVRPLYEKLSRDKNSKVNLRGRDRILKEINYLEDACAVLRNSDRISASDKKLHIQQKVSDNFFLRDFTDGKSTMKEKDLLFTLKVISEIRQKGFHCTVGIDFSSSDVNNFRFANGKMLIPFLAVAGLGKAVANKIVNYRETNGRINSWRENLKKLLNKKHFEQLKYLEENDLLI